MEIFGIILSVTVAFAASMLYCLFLEKVVLTRTALSRPMRCASCVVLALFCIEIILLETIGTVKSRGLLGPGFYVAHLFFFFLCTPALANILVLQRRRATVSRWYVAGLICTVFAFVLILLQYGVSEALYGIDGDDGPYSAVQNTSLSSSAKWDHSLANDPHKVEVEALRGV